MSLKSDHPLFRLAAVKLPEIKIQEHDELRTLFDCTRVNDLSKVYL